MSNTRKRKCKYCAEYVTGWIKVPAGVFCNFDHAIAFANQPKIKAATEKKIHAEKKTRLRDNNRSYWLKKSQESFNLWIRSRDKGLPCISCGKPDNGDVRHASHFKSRGSNSYLRFDRRNVNASCVKCNVYNSGALDGYSEGIIDRYGRDVLDDLNSSPRVKRYDIDYLKRLDRVCRKLAKRESVRNNCR